MIENEKWLPIVGYEGWYEVSDQGRIRSVDRIVHYSNNQSKLHLGRDLWAEEINTGYLRARLCKNQEHKRTLIQYLVLEAFVGPRPDGFHALHLDDNKTNNRLDNLRWDTHAENMKDKIRNNKQIKGTECPSSKLNDLKVKIIIEYIRQGVRIAKIAELFGVCSQLIYGIESGKRWKHITGGNRVW